VVCIRSPPKGINFKNSLHEAVLLHRDSKLGSEHLTRGNKIPGQVNPHAQHQRFWFNSHLMLLELFLTLRLNSGPILSHVRLKGWTNASKMGIIM
jgi:hypothetical protein